MEKTKKKKTRIFGIKLKSFIQVAMFVGTIVGYIIYFENRFNRIEFTMITKFNEVDRRFDKLEGEFRPIQTMVYNDLSWRYLYVHDPMRRNLVPIYDPVKRTLEFVDKTKAN